MSGVALLLMLISVTLIPAGDTAGKVMMADGVAPGFVAWSRFVLGALIVAGWLALSGRWPRAAVWRDWRLWLRGALIAGGILSILTALRTAPLASVFGAFFIGPMISAILSVVILGERMSALRVALLVIGFCGVLLVVRPGFGMAPGLEFAVLAGVFYGAYLTASRWLRDAAVPSALLVVQLVCGALLLVPIGAVSVPEPLAPVAGLTLVSALASMGGNLALILAYGRAEAGRLAPFVYLQLAAATVFGWAVFGDIPDGLTLLGIAVIAVSGLATLLPLSWGTGRSRPPRRHRR